MSNRGDRRQRTESVKARRLLAASRLWREDLDDRGVQGRARAHAVLGCRRAGCRLCSEHKIFKSLRRRLYERQAFKRGATED